MKRITLAMIETACAAVGHGIEGSLIQKAILKSAFDLVAPVGDWRGPIDKRLSLDACEYDPEVLTAAVEFFTGTRATVESVPMVCPTCSGYTADRSKCACGRRETRITAVGYRAGPCGP